MPKFDQLVSEQLNILQEQDTAGAPPAPGPGAPPASELGAPPAPGGDLGGGAPVDGTEDMDDDAKKEADPMEFTRSVLEKFIEVSPEMFENYLNSFSTNFLKIKDKQQFAHYYTTFYKELKHIFDIQDDLKDLFRQLQNDTEQLLSSDDTTPDQGEGGKGRPGPSGPGV